MCQDPIPGSSIGRFGCNVGIQIVRTPGHWTWYEIDGARVLVAPASEVLAYFV
jgi:hypothetical protein